MLYKYRYSLFAICAFCFAYDNSGARARDVRLESDANATTTEANSGTILDCISCLSKQPQLNQIIRAEKIAHRLEYIKQQLMSNLRVETPPTDLPKLEALPGFLLDQLVNSPSARQDKNSGESGADTKQMVLFPEEDAQNCHPSITNSICLTFKLGETLMLHFVKAAIIWLNSEKLSVKSSTLNFTVNDKSTLNAKNRNRRPKVLEIQESNGWYGLDIKEHLVSWQYYRDSKSHTFVIGCEDCQFVPSPTPDHANDTATSFLLLNTEKDENLRAKRGADCAPGSKECCRDNLEVEFASLGDLYRMILYPAKFNAFMCRGSCFYHSVVDTEKHYVSLLMNLKLNKTSNIQLPTTCCTPTKFSSLSVIYATSNTTFEKALIPNMVVEGCGCV